AIFQLLFVPRTIGGFTSATRGGVSEGRCGAPASGGGTMTPARAKRAKSGKPGKNGKAAVPSAGRNGKAALPSPVRNGRAALSSRPKVQTTSSKSAPAPKAEAPRNTVMPVADAKARRRKRAAPAGIGPSEPERDILDQYLY